MPCTVQVRGGLLADFGMISGMNKLIYMLNPPTRIHEAIITLFFPTLEHLFAQHSAAQGLPVLATCLTKGRSTVSSRPT